MCACDCLCFLFLLLVVGPPCQQSEPISVDIPYDLHWFNELHQLCPVRLLLYNVGSRVREFHGEHSESNLLANVHKHVIFPKLPHPNFFFLIEDGRILKEPLWNVYVVKKS